MRQPGLPDPRVPPSRSYVICATPRTGSWLLCGLLHSTGVAGRPHEWFLDAMEEVNGRAWAARDFAHYVELATAAGTTPNGVFGMKVMWDYQERLLARLRVLGGVDGSDRAVLERCFPQPRFVWLRREDVRAQAESWARAVQTGVWAHWDEPCGAPAHAPEQVAALAGAAREHDAAWGRWFAGQGIEPLVVRYEDLAADPSGVAAEVAAFVGVQADGFVTLTARTPKT